MRVVGSAERGRAYAAALAYARKTIFEQWTLRYNSDMSISDIAQLLFRTGLFCFLLVVVAIVGSFSGRGQSTSPRRTLQILLSDYKDKDIAYGGPLGLMRILFIGGLALIALSAIVYVCIFIVHVFA